MKLYKDGTIEGTPAEIAEYGKLTAVQQHPFKITEPVVKYLQKSISHPISINKQLKKEIEEAKKELLDRWGRDSARLLFGSYDANKPGDWN